jgi:hypothetical protein
MNNNETKDKVVTDVNELNSIQDELVSNSGGKFIKLPKPIDAKYKRKTLTRDMAICLVFVYKHYRYSDALITDYFPKRVLLQYIKDFPRICDSYVKLKYWDLITPMPTSPTEVIYKKGWYGITENCLAFIQKEIALPKYAFVYNGFAYEHNPIPVMITDLINEEDLEELLKP